MKNLNTRREFLKLMGVAANTTAFLSIAPWVSAFADENGKNVAASDRVRVGVIGVGGRGRGLVDNLNSLKNVEIVAVCDNYEPNYQIAINKTKGKAQAFYDYRKLLEVKSMDAVVIATPLHEHAHMTIEAMAAGYHVLCEKSMARTMEDCKQMVDAQKTTGKILQIGLQHLFNPVYLNALERIRAGEIGQIVQIRSYWHRNDDWRRKVPSPELERKLNWRMYQEYSGGLMTELATHQLQVANWFLDGVPSQVRGSGSIVYWKDGREVYDSVNLVYDYDNGVKCIYDSMIANKHYGAEEQIMGNLGNFELQKNLIYKEELPVAPGIRQLLHNVESGIFEVIPIGGATWLPETAVPNKGNMITSYDHNDTYLMLEGFAKAVRAGKPYKNLLREGYHATITSLLGLQAMDSNQVLSWPADYYMEKEI